MKNFILSLTLIVACFSVQSVYAQKKAEQKAVISTPGIQDEPCKERIEKYLSREYGVTFVNANYKRHTVTVKYLTDRTNTENIKTAIANLGYDADDVTAEPTAYKRLPKNCQHKEQSK